MDWVFASLSETTWIFWTGYFSLSFLVWYLFNGFEAWLNGGQMGRGKWWVFSCVYEEMLWHLPGGKMRIQRHLQKIMCRLHIKNGIVTHEYNDVEYYEAQARSMTRWPKHCYFWGIQMFGAWFLWPVLVSLLLLVIVFNNFFYDMYLLFKWITSTNKEAKE